MVAHMRNRNRLRFNQYVTAEERFDAAYTPEPNTGCWLWLGSASPTSGDGRDWRPTFKVNGKPVRSYRFSYERFVGEIPRGKMICHKCNVPLCVNPEHLYAGTAVENAADCVAAGTHPAQLYPEVYKEHARRLGRRPKPKRAMPERSKIDYAAIPSMRKRLAKGATLREIANEYGVTRQAIYQLLKREAARAALRLAGEDQS